MITKVLVRRAILLAAAMVAAMAIGSAGTAQAHGGFYFHPHAPFKSGTSIGSTGHLAMSYSHGYAQITVRAQRKVCGFWGCNYHTKAERSVTMNFSSAYSGHPYVYQPCIRGTHRYRTHVSITIREVTYTYSNASMSGGIQYTC